MAKKLSMEERLKLKIANLGKEDEEENVKKITSEPIKEQKEITEKVANTENKGTTTESEPVIEQSKERKEKKSIINRYEKKDEKMIENNEVVENKVPKDKSNDADKEKRINTDKLVNFIRNENGKYFIGGIILFLLIAYVFGMFISFTSASKPITANPFKAIYYAITSGGMITFILVVIIMLALVLLITVKERKNQETDRKFGTSDALGSGGIATKEDEDKLLVKTKELDDQPYYVFGKNDKGLWVGINPKIDINHFFAICGPQQSGKSFMLVKNNLTQLAKEIGRASCRERVYWLV